MPLTLSLDTASDPDAFVLTVNTGAGERDVYELSDTPALITVTDPDRVFTPVSDTVTKAIYKTTTKTSGTVTVVNGLG